MKTESRTAIDCRALAPPLFDPPPAPAAARAAPPLRSNVPPAVPVGTNASAWSTCAGASDAALAVPPRVSARRRCDAASEAVEGARVSRRRLLSRCRASSLVSDEGEVMLPSAEAPSSELPLSLGRASARSAVLSSPSAPSAGVSVDSSRKSSRRFRSTCGPTSLPAASFLPLPWLWSDEARARDMNVLGEPPAPAPAPDWSTSLVLVSAPRDASSSASSSLPLVRRAAPGRISPMLRSAAVDACSSSIEVTRAASGAPSSPCCVDDAGGCASSEAKVMAASSDCGAGSAAGAGPSSGFASPAVLAREDSLGPKELLLLAPPTSACSSLPFVAASPPVDAVSPASALPRTSPALLATRESAGALGVEAPDEELVAAAFPLSPAMAGFEDDAAPDGLGRRLPLLPPAMADWPSLSLSV